MLRTHGGPRVLTCADHRKLQDFLDPRRVGPLRSGWYGGRPLLDGLLDHRSDGFEVAAQSGQEAHCCTFAIAKQCEEDVLGPDVFMPECCRIVAGGLQRPAGTVSEVVAIHRRPPCSVKFIQAMGWSCRCACVAITRA